MDKRSTKRIKTRHFASISGIPGVVDDISEEGMRLSASQLPKKKKVEIIFEAFGRSIRVEGIIRWFIRRSTVNSYHQLGVIVKDPPDEFKSLIKKI